MEVGLRSAGKVMLELSLSGMSAIVPVAVVLCLRSEVSDVSETCFLVSLNCAVVCLGWH